MARKPDVPCSACGTLLWSGSTSRPAGQRFCRPCRRTGVARGQSQTQAMDCEVCSARFVPKKAHQRTCSLSCGQRRRHSVVTEADRLAAQRARWQRKNRRRRALKRGAAVEPYSLTEIAVRDCYRCGLCRRKVRMDRPWPHPMSPTIDHVVPIVDGGDDTRANVQLAHLGCNSRKGARGSQQLALIG